MQDIEVGWVVLVGVEGMGKAWVASVIQQWGDWWGARIIMLFCPSDP